jgi:dTDP-4-dehydrorhamnose reductase
MEEAKKILILGAKGMLGSDLCFVFKKNQPICWDRQDLDITNIKEVFRKINKLNPGVVINAAAYTNVEMAEKEFVLAKKINVEAVKNLAEICVKIGATLVHYSTDYIFNGKKKNGYIEKDKPVNPINRYGFSKLLGEKEILKNRELKYYLIRISWLFGSKIEPKKHKNFVQTILKLAQEKEELKIINDQFGKPTYTFDLAQATKKLLVNKKPFGIYHLPNEGETTWYEFAKEIIRLSKFQVRIFPCRTSEYKTLAKRPRYSILINTKFTKLRSWKLALKDYLKGFVSDDMSE